MVTLRVWGQCRHGRPPGVPAQAASHARLSPRLFACYGNSPILATLLPVFLITGCGTLYGRYRRPDIRGLNTLNMELFVPMLVFEHVQPMAS
ncbi:hypothetical protein FHR97_002532 [Halomonas stenophila]|uniref:Uncharacterized protein n=1 Tax=Halomonas stenophila TaxID=795312 RepID=A0A7W5HLY7_9GAMM|nr:hypothetical protein [Halomonas stenophila]MBB3231673.1 hypothetical protein [Halomonas stenophila]